MSKKSPAKAKLSLANEVENLPDYPLVLVEWIDSAFDRGGWNTFDADRDGAATTCLSTGFLVHEGKNIIRVVPHIGNTTDEMAGGMSIPNSAVVAIYELQ